MNLSHSGGLTSVPWRAIVDNGWFKTGGGIVIGTLATIIWSFAPDAFWVHDNRQALNTLLTSQPLIQRDISDLRNQLSENTIALKELAVELQRKREPNKFYFQDNPGKKK